MLKFPYVLSAIAVAACISHFYVNNFLKSGILDFIVPLLSLNVDCIVYTAMIVFSHCFN